MKIVLATARKEENNILALMGVVSYAHRLQKELGVEAIFFPRNRLSPLDDKEKRILEATCRDTGLVIGIGSKEKNEDVYLLFGPGVSTSITAEDDPVYLPLTVPLLVSMRLTPFGSPLPLVYLGEESSTKESALRAADPRRETYYLGSSIDIFEAAVLEKGLVKCEIPSSAPNFLLKSVPDPYVTGE